MRKLILSLIRFYQKFLSLDQGFLRVFVHGTPFYRVCRFQPTCSEYTYQAIEKYGILRGVTKGFFRVLRCNPYSKGGEDKLL